MMSDKALPGDFTLLLLDAFHMEATELGSAKIALGLLKQKHFQRAARSGSKRRAVENDFRAKPLSPFLNHASPRQ